MSKRNKHNKLNKEKSVPFSDIDELESEDSEFFSFGDPEPVLGNPETDYTNVFVNTTEQGDFLQPPIDLEGLAKIEHANAHHGRAIIFKRNMLAKYYVDNDILPLSQFLAWSKDFESFGMAYLKEVRNVFGELLEMKH